MVGTGKAAGPGVDARRLTGGEWAVGGASLALLVSLFLPWFNLNVFGRRAAVYAGIDSIILWAVIPLAVIILALTVVRASLGRIPFAPPPVYRFLLVGLTVLNLALVLLVLVMMPTVRGVPDAAVAAGVITATRSYGGFVGLAAAVAAVVGSLLRSSPAAAGGGVAGGGVAGGGDA